MPKKKTWTAGIWMTIADDSMWVWVVAKGKYSSEEIDCMWSTQITGINEQEALEKAKNMFLKEHNQGKITENIQETKAA